jgi:hypothetical protein
MKAVSALYVGAAHLHCAIQSSGRRYLPHGPIAREVCIGRWVPAAMGSSRVGRRSVGAKGPGSDLKRTSTAKGVRSCPLSKPLLLNLLEAFWSSVKREATDNIRPRVR